MRRKDLTVLGAELTLRFLEVRTQRLKFSTPDYQHMSRPGGVQQALGNRKPRSFTGAALRLYDGQKQTGADQNILTDTEENF